MLRKNDQEFIIEKIEALQSALFFSDSNDRVIPSCILQRVYTDEESQVWFAIPKPMHVIDTNNISFPCRMDFFKKGAAFHVKITGLATVAGEEAIAGCPLQLADAMRLNNNQQQLVFKVKMEHADCFEIPPAPADKKASNKSNALSHMLNKITGQFLVSHQTPPRWRIIKRAKKIR